MAGAPPGFWVTPCWGQARAQPRQGWADESRLRRHLGGGCLALETSGPVAGPRPLGSLVVCSHPLLDSQICTSSALASQPRSPVKLHPETWGSSLLTGGWW